VIESYFDIEHGLALDGPVLEKIYGGNFRRLVGERPKAVDVAATRAYLGELIDGVSGAAGQEQIPGELGEIRARPKSGQGPQAGMPAVLARE